VLEHSEAIEQRALRGGAVGQHRLNEVVPLPQRHLQLQLRVHARAIPAPVRVGLAAVGGDGAGEGRADPDIDQAGVVGAALQELAVAEPRAREPPVQPLLSGSSEEGAKRGSGCAYRTFSMSQGRPASCGTLPSARPSLPHSFS